VAGYTSFGVAVLIAIISVVWLSTAYTVNPFLPPPNKSNLPIVLAYPITTNGQLQKPMFITRINLESLSLVVIVMTAHGY
jgi:hypothetical protein